MGHCARLQNVDFTGLTNVTSFGGFFMRDCTAIPNLHFCGLTNVTSFWEGFMSNCTALENVDFISLVKINTTSFGKPFMSGCLKVASVTVPNMGWKRWFVDTCIADFLSDRTIPLCTFLRHALFFLLLQRRIRISLYFSTTLSAIHVSCTVYSM